MSTTPSGSLEAFADLREAIDAFEQHGDHESLAAIASGAVATIESFWPFIRDVVNKPFPWEAGGQVTTWMQREQYEAAVAALGALSGA